MYRSSMVQRTKKNTVLTLCKYKKEGRPIACVTAYDATMARLVASTGVDVILVGDSLGVVFQGHETTLPVTLDEMIYHCRAVVRGAGGLHVVGDLPFMSYQASVQQAIESAGRLVKEGGVSAVKLEGGLSVAAHVSAITEAGIPVMGHIGLTPQSFHQMGGYRIQGREKAQAAKLLKDADALVESGVYALVLEGIPQKLASEISIRIPVPTIGIGAGAGCDGQILVVNDLLGLDPELNLKMVKKYESLGEKIQVALTNYVNDVREHKFPTEEHSFD
jgi:3-methyl-2-oxobutanoate hydroxymethyltransferase